MESCSFFDGINEPSPAFAHKLDILLTWSVTPLQYGDHRPYAAVSLLQCWRDKAEEHAIRRDRASPNDNVQDYLFDWLDVSEVARDENNLASVALLFDQLVKHCLFDYGLYIQRLIARGEQGLSFADVSLKLLLVLYKSLKLSCFTANAVEASTVFTMDSST